MRAIFLVLLIANLAFFSHQFFIADKAKAEAPPAGASGRTGNGLKLLSESSDGIKKRTNTVPTQKAITVPEENVASGTGDRLCTMVGPYEQLLHAEYLVERLAALGAQSVIKPVEIKAGNAYWVYLEPEISEKEALRRLYELQKKHVESYIITKGELTNGISFGRYSDLPEAEARLLDIKNQGYEAQINAFPKTISEIWVLLEPENAEKIDEAAWLTLLNDQEGLEKRQNFCLGVASA